ncbi:conserved hypothetical protein [Mycoplasmopsis alligatoris A21JP2]|uniref:Uncharacterized protein n=1 Tax=Mycoplasmopsis alligatoris A21JP2 TaxID=747682 RepID=D4XW32_9BACT|nr:conserved hypothetical protein [Mycoplasmopsis alligatoris A21JP2]
MPNDILGMEYVKTIVNKKLKITPICMQRTIGFHSQEINQNFASASKLRQMLNDKIDIKDYTPVDYGKYNFEKPIELEYEKFRQIVKTKSAQELQKYKMISEGIENLFKKNVESKTYQEFVERCTSKRYTSSRIKRTMLFILLKIKK